MIGPDFTDMGTQELDEVVQIFLEDQDAERKMYEKLEEKRVEQEEKARRNGR